MKENHCLETWLAARQRGRTFLPTLKNKLGLISTRTYEVKDLSSEKRDPQTSNPLSFSLVILTSLRLSGYAERYANSDSYDLIAL